MKVKAAAIQLDVKVGDVETNISKAISWVDNAAEEKVQLICFPEYFSTGYPSAKFAEPIPGSTTERLARKAEEHKMFIVAGSIVEKGKNGKLYSTVPLIGPNGEVVGIFRKIHLLDALYAVQDEKGCGMTRGESYPVFETSIGIIGMLAGSDTDTPEPSRIMALKGADIIVVPNSSTIDWLDWIRFVPRARAGENQVYLVTANRVGPWKGSPLGDVLYPGGSMIVGSVGEVLATAGEIFSYEGMAIATLDIDKLREGRKYGMFARIWVPETYGPIVELSPPWLGKEKS